MHKNNAKYVGGKDWAREKKNPKSVFIRHSELPSLPGVHCISRHINIEKARSLMTGGRIYSPKGKMTKFGGYEYCAFCGSRNFEIDFPKNLENGWKWSAVISAADRSKRGRAVLRKLYYENEYYDAIRKICPDCLNKELERMHIDMSAYQQELADIKKRVKEHEASKAKAGDGNVTP